MDKGYGKFGSIEWHKNQIDALDDSQLIREYVLKLSNVFIPPSLTLEQTKQQAIQAIQVH